MAHTCGASGTQNCTLRNAMLQTLRIRHHALFDALSTLLACVSLFLPAPRYQTLELTLAHS